MSYIFNLEIDQYIAILTNFPVAAYNYDLVEKRKATNSLALSYPG